MARTVPGHGQFGVGLLAIHGKKCGLCPIVPSGLGAIFEASLEFFCKLWRTECNAWGSDIKCGDPIQFDKMGFSPKLFLEG